MTLEILTSFFTLTLLEIVLGIDNIVFISILVQKLEKSVQKKARIIGLAIAMITRIMLLLAISWIMRLVEPIAYGFSGKDFILFGGGLFLIWKATTEIHEKIEHSSKDPADLKSKRIASFSKIITQIVLIDIVFSLDSVITAVGIADHLSVMISAVIVSVLVMMFFAGYISEFIDKYPTFKVLALSFLILVGVILVADAFGKHIEKGYIYFAMGFSFAVEIINTKIKSGNTAK